jgi:hypothetical protein
MTSFSNYADYNASDYIQKAINFIIGQMFSTGNLLL